MNRRHWMVGAIAAAGAIGAAVLVAQGERAPVAAAASLQQPAGEAPAFVPDLARNPVPGMQADPFAGQRSAPVAAPVRPAPAPSIEAAPRPQTPPFPYKYAGKLDRAGEAKGEVYLAKGSELLPISAGQVLDASWKIDAVSADRLHVTHVPSGQASMLLFSALVADSAAPLPTQSVESVADVQIAEAPSTSSITGRSSGPVAAPVGGTHAGGIGPSMQRASEAAQAGAPQAAAPRATGSAAGAINAQGPVPTGTLGSDAPSSGSMPTGPAPASTARLGL